MMRFDDYWDETDDDAGQVSKRQPVPDGTHAARISRVQLVQKDWAKADKNPTGDCLEITVDVGSGYWPLRETIPVGWRGKLGAVCDACRVPAPERGVEWDEQQLEGCTVNVETSTAVSKAGSEYVKVVRWRVSADGPAVDRPAKRAAKKAAVRTQAARVMEDFDDDVPF